MLLATPAPGRLAVPTIAGAPINSTKTLTEPSLRIPGSKPGMAKEEPRTDLKNDCWTEIVCEKGIREEGKQKKRSENRRYVGGGRFLEDKEVIRYFTGGE